MALLLLTSIYAKKKNYRSEYTLILPSPNTSLRLIYNKIHVGNVITIN